MNEIEEQLHKVLSRKEPPPGFAERLQEKFAAREQRQFRWWKSPFDFLLIPKIRWMVAGLSICLVLSLVYQGYQSHRREQLEGERAKDQLVTALRITNEKLTMVQKKLSKLQNRETLIRVAQ